MTEPYPIVDERGEVKGYVSSLTEFTLLRPADRWGSEELFLWTGSRAYRVNHLVSEGFLRFGEAEVPLEKWVEKVPIAHGYVAPSLEDYADELAKRVGEKLSGKKVLLSFSGGKDSTACLLLLLKLSEVVSFEVRVCYVHMPYLESNDNPRFVELVSQKLGVEVEVASPPKKLVRRYLLRYGLPYRRMRWCTYLKAKPLRLMAKEFGADYEVAGDRVWEATKRMRRFAAYAAKESLLEGKRFRPIYALTTLDVVKACREAGLVHPHYLRGLSRVACAYCPYKSSYELSLGLEPEDPGFVEEVLKKSYSHWYSRHISIEDFVEHHLWRYVPSVAKMFARVKRSATDALGEAPSLSIEEVSEMYRSSWTMPTPKAPMYSLEEIMNLLKEKE